MTKGELRSRVDQLERDLDMATRDRDDACDALRKLEHRYILVKVYRDHEMVDAVVIPPNGLMSSFAGTGDDSVDIVTEVVS